MHRIHWSAAPADASPVQKRNFLNVQINAVGLGRAGTQPVLAPVVIPVQPEQGDGGS